MVKKTIVEHTVTKGSEKGYTPKKNKYQVNNIPFNLALLSDSQANTQTPTGATAGWLYQRALVVPSGNVAGTRKAGKFTISLSLEGKKESLIYWALVFVSQDLTYPYWLNPSSTESIYQNGSAVLASGMNDTNAGPVRIYCPLFKNLNQNEKLYLCMAVKPVDDESMDDAEKVEAGSTISGLIRYAVCFN